MKKKLYYLGLVVWGVCGMQSGYGQYAKWEWVRSAGYFFSDNANSMTTDVRGNIYMVGAYFEEITFDTIKLINSSTLLTPYIVKYNSKGKVLWAKTTSRGKQTDKITSVITDDSGNLYVAGEYNSDTLKFDTFTIKRTWSEPFYNGIFW
ncbi:MAG: hypothetical protein NTX03_04080 [Bacteroidetes bacterium]|nr:hypothetical protein [Bacteroidota bacterium]